MSPVAVAQSFSDSTEIHCIFPVLQITSYFHSMGPMCLLLRQHRTGLHCQYVILTSSYYTSECGTGGWGKVLISMIALYSLNSVKCQILRMMDIFYVMRQRPVKYHLSNPKGCQWGTLQSCNNVIQQHAMYDVKCKHCTISK